MLLFQRKRFFQPPDRMNGRGAFIRKQALQRKRPEYIDDHCKASCSLCTLDQLQYLDLHRMSPFLLLLKASIILSHCCPLSRIISAIEFRISDSIRRRAVHRFFFRVRIF